LKPGGIYNVEFFLLIEVELNWVFTDDVFLVSGSLKFTFILSWSFGTWSGRSVVAMIWKFAYVPASEFSVAEMTNEKELSIATEATS
jgi:hypothetical protein